MSSPASMLPRQQSTKSKWGSSSKGKASGRRMTTKDCTSIVEGLKVIYFSKVPSLLLAFAGMVMQIGVSLRARL